MGALCLTCGSTGRIWRTVWKIDHPAKGAQRSGIVQCLHQAIRPEPAVFQEVPELAGEKVRIPVAAVYEERNSLRRQRATFRGVHYRSPRQEVIRRHTQSTLSRTERLQNLLKTVKTRELIHAQQRLILRR